MVYFVGFVIDCFYSQYFGIVIDIQEIMQDQIEVQFVDDRFDVGIVFEFFYSVEIDSELLFCEMLSFVVGGGYVCVKCCKLLLVQDFVNEWLVLLNKVFVMWCYIDEYCLWNQICFQVVIEVSLISVIVEIVWCGQFVIVLFDGVVCEYIELYFVLFDLLLLVCMVVLL